MRALLLDERLAVDATGFVEQVGVTEGRFHELLALSPLDKDGEEHRRWRTVLSRLFTPRRIQRITPHLEQRMDQLLDGVVDAGECELMGEVAGPFALHSLCALMGVPLEEEEDRFGDLALEVGRLLSWVPQRLDELEAALEPLEAYVDDLLARRAADPRDDAVSQIARDIDGDLTFPPHTGRMTVTGLIFTGLETVRCQLGWSVAVLAGRAELWDGIARGEIALKGVVEELLRLRSVNGALGRLVVEDFEYRGRQFRAGERIFLSLWAANGDHHAYCRPEAIDPDRSESPHLAFGLGAHYCLGAALARADLAIALAAMTRRLPCPVVAPGVRWKPAISPTGPDRLPLRFTTAT